LPGMTGQRNPWGCPAVEQTIGETPHPVDLTAAALNSRPGRSSIRQVIRKIGILCRTRTTCLQLKII
jgi:hypothetical protein